MAQEISAWSLLIVSILVSRFHNFSFTVSYSCFISCISFLICFSRSMSVASTLSDICCSFSSVALVRLKQLSRLSFLLYHISLFSSCRSSSLHFSLLSICSNFVIRSSSQEKLFFMVRLRSTFFLLFVLFDLCCYCGNCSKRFAFLGR